MSAVSKLIDVTFKDNTNYSNSVATGDVVGAVFEHCWGPVDKLNTFTYSDFMKAYPEGLPANIDAASDINRWFAYAQIKRAFESGASYVEAYRVKGSWPYINFRMSMTTSAVTFEATSDEEMFGDAATQNTIFRAALVYPGIFPSTGDFASYIKYRMYVDTESNSTTGEVISPIRVRLYGIVSEESTGSEEKKTLLEEFSGSLDKKAVVDGASFFIGDIINANSQYIRIDVNKNTDFDFGTGIGAEFNYTTLGTVTKVTVSEYVSAVACFSDPEMSNSTILIAPLPNSSDNKSVYTALSKCATDRKDCSTLAGYDTMAESFNRESIETAWRSYDAEHDMFSTFIACREQYAVFGNTIYLDGTAGWAGRICAIASANHVNQLPSAKTYGSYGGNLVKSLSFDDVLELHDLGCNSIYSSPFGNYIWGIKNCHSRKTSYFSKYNVTRVVNWLLKYTYPLVLQAIHTETVSDSFMRLQFLQNLKSIISTMSSQGNIKEESDVSIETDDIKTKGGEILIFYYDIYFKKLTEKCQIQITATDSSVSATIL